MLLEGQLHTRMQDDTHLLSMSALNLHSIEWSFVRTATPKKKMPTVVATNLHRSKSKTSRPKQYPTTMTRCRRPWGSTWRASCRESETDISWLAGRTLAQPQLTEDFDFSLKALQVKGSWSLSRLDFSWGDVLVCVSKNMRFEVWRGERNKKSNITTHPKRFKRMNIENPYKIWCLQIQVAFGGFFGEKKKTLHSWRNSQDDRSWIVDVVEGHISRHLGKAYRMVRTQFPLTSSCLKWRHL